MKTAEEFYRTEFKAVPVDHTDYMFFANTYAKYCLEYKGVK